MTKTYQDVISEIKDKLDIVEVVSEHVILKKSGGSYWGLCPFHKEKSPSFSVNPQRQIFKCFGCGEGGDAITFLMKVLSKNFNEVIKDLAAKFGIELPDTYGNSAEQKDKKESTLAALKKTAAYYTDNLLNSADGKTALEYLTKRGITEDVIKHYQLGYAAGGFEALQNKLDKECTKDALEDAGLIIKRDKQTGYVDRFRARITIPILDEAGNIVAFGARSLNSEQNPKYLNSPDTIVYNKSKILYGLYEAKDSIKEQDSVILMEGYFDVISAQINGVKNCIASCGTSLTNEHVKLISRYTKSRKIYLAFDSDDAGSRATTRNADLIKEALGSLGDIKQFDQSFLPLSEDKYACELRVVTPIEGKDPDEFIREQGGEAYIEYIKKAPLLLDFQLDEIVKLKTPEMSATDKLKLVKMTIPLITQINNNIMRDEYIKIVAQKLSVNEISLKNEISGTRTNERIAPDTSFKRDVKKNDNISQKAQKNLLSLFLINESHLNLEELNKTIPADIFTDEMLKNIKCTIDKHIYEINNVSELLNALFTEFAENETGKEIITDLIYVSDTFKNLQEIDFKYLINEQINNIERYKLHSKQSKIRAQYKQTNSDDEQARAVQMQLKKQLETKFMTGDNK